MLGILITYIVLSRFIAILSTTVDSLQLRDAATLQPACRTPN